MAAANIPIESSVDTPLADKHYPNRLFEDRSGKADEFSGAFVIYGLNHEKKTEKQQSVYDYVCDAIWDMGFDAKPDFFSSVSRLSGMKNAPLVCELKKMHMKLGNEILESLEDVSRIHTDILLPSKEVIISKFLPPPPQFMINFSKKISRTADPKTSVIEAAKALGLDITEDKISFAEVAFERYNCIVCEFSDINIAKKFYNFRDVITVLPKSPVYSISLYREHKDFYYDKMLIISGLNNKIKDCTKLFLDVCQELDVDITPEDVSRCEWLYSKAFKSRAQRSPLVVQFTSEEKRVAVFQASVNEAKISNDYRLSGKPRKPRAPRKLREKKGEDKPAEEAEEPAPVAEEPEQKEEEEPAEAEVVYRKVYINPMISLPYSMLYTAARDLAKRHRSLVCLPMSFYGKISLAIKEQEEEEAAAVKSEDEENKASAVDDLTESFKSMSLDGKIIQITSPYDFYKIDTKFRSAALTKYFMYTDPLYCDVGFMLEPYEWFSRDRKNEKRLSRTQLERLQPH